MDVFAYSIALRNMIVGIRKHQARQNLGNDGENCVYLTVVDKIMESKPNRYVEQYIGSVLDCFRKYRRFTARQKHVLNNMLSDTTKDKKNGSK